MMASDIRPGDSLFTELDDGPTVEAIVGSVQQAHGEVTILAFTGGEDRQLVKWTLPATTDL